MPTALLVGKIHHCRKEWEELSSHLTLKEYPTGDRSDFISRLKNDEYNDVVVIYRSNESNSITGPFNSELVAHLPSSLKYIVHNGAGYDNIDIPACTKAGIQVSSTPIAVNDATADIAIFLLLASLRRMHIPLTAVRQGQWRGATFTLGHDPRGKTLGILGMGGIGRAVASRAAAFGMKIIYHNRNRLSAEAEAASGNATWVSFEDLLSTSDVLSVNVALTPETRHKISAREFAQMKPGAVLVNTARGPIVDEDALVSALEAGTLFSAGLDVYENEPEIHPGLLKSDKVVLLPHVGTATFETQREMELLVLTNLKAAVLEGKGLVTRVAEQEGKFEGDVEGRGRL